MNEHGGSVDSQPDPAAQARNWPDWNMAVSARDHPGEEAAELAARISATPARITAGRARAETRLAFHSPSPVVRDAELVQIHAEAGRFFQSRLPGSWVPGYLASRGLAAALLPSSPWKIGYAPASWTALTGHLRQLGHCDAALLRSGLVTTGKDGHLRDWFHDRLMIPLRAEDRVVIAFIGRRHPSTGDTHGPKYLNSPDTELFIKGHVLAGLAEGRPALQAGAQPVLVEGPLDAIAVSIAAPGRFTGVTPCGTALTGVQAALLARAVDLCDRGLRVALDADAAGRKAAVRAYDHLAHLTSDLSTVTFPDGCDPAQMLQNDGPPALRAILTTSIRPLADLVVDARIHEWSRSEDLIFTEQQMGALRAAAKVIATMPADHVGPQAARLAALYTTRYGWHPEEATREIIDAIEHHYQPAAPARAAPTADHAGVPSAISALLSNATAPPHPRAAADGREKASRRSLSSARHLPLERN
jgi:DNA primase